MTDKAKEQAFERAQERAVMNYNAWCAGAINLQPDESRFFCDAGYAAALASRPAETPRETEPVAMVLHCPECRARHIDVGEFATKRHHTHACQNCGLTWRPAIVPTVGVQFLPGFKNECTAHPAVTPQPKTEPCTCNAQRDGDMQWTHAPNCPRSESWQRRVAKDASAQPKTEERCPAALLPDGPICPRCGGPRGPSGVDGGSWVHYRQPRGTEHSVAKDASAAEPERECEPELAQWILTNSGCCESCGHEGARWRLRENAEGAKVCADCRMPDPAPTVAHTTTPTEPEGGSDFAWLIERTDGPIPTYWDGRATRNNHGPRVTYHHDANSAVRFARQEDAERIIAWLLEGEPVVAREHGWFRATAAPSDPQPSEQEEEAAFRTWRDQNGLASHRAAFDAGREYERNHRPAIDIEDIIKHCRLSLDAKSVSLPELRKALQKATGKEKVNGE